MFIAELFEPGKNYEWQFRGSEEAMADFKVGNVPYRFYAFTDSSTPGSWEVEFKNNTRDKPMGRTAKFGLTGTGNAAEVMSIVSDIMREFLQQYKGSVKAITFTADEASRKSLYMRMVKRLLPDWDLTIHDKNLFVVTAPKELNEYAEHFNGIELSLEIQKDDEYVDDEDYDNQVVYVTATSNGRELGHVLFSFDGEYLMPQDLEVEERFRGQGIAQTMYDYVKSKGYKIRRSGQQTDAGAGFWDKHRPEQNVWEDELNEVNIDTDYNPDELTVKQKFIDYFTNKGYKFLGEGRDQIAFLSPRDTVLKVLGLGDTHRQQAVEHYVEFFERNQRNPFYPRIYNSQRFTFDGDSYFLYETEYLQYVSNEDDTLDWLERYLNHLGTDPVEAQNWVEANGVPDDIGEDQLYGLTQSTEDIIEYLAGPKGYMMDLGNIENIRRRSDGHLVIVDPISI